MSKKDSSKKVLGKRLALLRKKRSMTQTQLAEQIGMSHSSVASWESGSRDPNTDMVAKLAEFFNTSTDYLIGKSVGALIEKQLDNMGKTLEWLSEQTKIPLKNLQNIDNVQPHPGEYEPGDIIDRITRALAYKGDILFTAYSRQEPPAYDGPSSSATEDFEDLDFEDGQKENSALIAVEGVTEELYVLEALKAIAKKHNYNLNDPEFIDNIDKALAFVKSIRSNKKD